LSQHEIFFIVCSYLLGSIPFGFVFYFLTGKKAISEEGSGDIRSANIIRTKGKRAGIFTLVLDMLKGIIVIAYGLRHYDSPITIMLGGAAVIIGHLFPLYLKFKGGKGVAVLVGVFMVFDFPSAVVFASVFFLTLFFTKYVSAASIAGATALFFFILFTHIVEVSTIVLVVILLIIGKHRSNIQRLTAGTENKFKWKING
jgi:glycerol-3-phosphate acyltransferase PlsY